MSSETPSQTSRNRLLNGLDTHDANLVRPQLSLVTLQRHQRLETANRPVEFVYFIESGVVSMVASLRSGGMRSSVAIVGFEGMTGLSTIYGVPEPTVDTIVASGGTAFRIDAATLADLVRRSGTLQRRLALYAYALNAQFMFSILTRTKASIEQKLCLTLLILEDKLETRDIGLTHDMLAEMQGIRRPAISIALKRLEHLQLISTQRGNLGILDRDGLIKIAHPLYGLSENEYERLLK